MEKESYFEKIGSYIKTSVALSAYLSYILKEDTFKRKHIIRLSDKYFSTPLYIGSGTLRLYSLEQEEETTILFWQQNEFIVQMPMLDTYLKKDLYIEFLEDSTLTGFTDKHIPNLFKLFPEYRELVNNLYQAQIAELIQHSISLAHHDSNPRFEYLQNTKPRLFNICDLKIIANYLGIHPKVLSLLRSKSVKR